MIDLFFLWFENIKKKVKSSTKKKNEIPSLNIVIIIDHVIEGIHSHVRT